MDKDRVAGSVQKVTGKIKEQAGKALGDQQTKAEGRADRAEGRVQSAAGHAKDAVREIAGKKKRPRNSGAFQIVDDNRLGGLLCNHGLLGNSDLLRLSNADLDLTRLRGLRDFAGQLDMQHAVREARADDLDVVGEAETTLEGAPRDAAMQVIVMLRLLLRLAGHQKSVLLHRHIQLVT